MDRYAETDLPSGEEALAWAIATVCDGTRRDRYAKYRSYYEGKHDLKFATAKFNQAFGNLFTEFAYNRCRAVIGAHTDRLFVESFDAGENAQMVDDAEELWGLNRMDEVQLEVHRAALIYGAGYLYIWTDPLDELPVVMWPQDPCVMAVRYRDDVPTKLEVAGKVWRTRDNYVRATLYFPDRLERWISNRSLDKSVVPKVRDMQPFFGDGLGAVILNPYDQVPIVPFFNHRSLGDTCGTSELTDVIPLQNAMNKTLTDEMITEEFLAYPQRWVTGLDVGINPYADQSLEARTNDETMRKFAAGASRILTLSDPNSKVGTFDAANLAQYTDMGEFWDKAISRVSRVPVHYLTLSGDFPSGRALRTAESPFVAKLEAQQRDFGNDWEDAVRFALRVANKPAEGRFSAKWRSAAPMAMEDTWDLILQQVSVGVPLEIALADAGWSESKLDELKKTKEANMQQQMELAAQGAPPENRGGPPDAQQANRTRDARRGSMRIVS